MHQTALVRDIFLEGQSQAFHGGKDTSSPIGNRPVKGITVLGQKQQVQENLPVRLTIRKPPQKQFAGRMILVEDETPVPPEPVGI